MEAPTIIKLQMHTRLSQSTCTAMPPWYLMAMREKGCHTIQAEGYADVDVVKAAVAMSAYKSTTLIGEDTDMLVLLLYQAAANDCKDLYFRSDKGKPNVYNMKANI